MSNQHIDANIKIANWLGWKYEPSEDIGHGYEPAYWVRPDGIAQSNLPEFHIDLEAFDYIMAKLLQPNTTLAISSTPETSFVRFKKVIIFTAEYTYSEGAAYRYVSGIGDTYHAAVCDLVLNLIG